MKYNQEAIAKYIFHLHQFCLPGFYSSEESDPKWTDIEESDQGNHKISKEFYLNIASFFIETYLVNLEKRAIDEILESIAIFFSKIHAASLPFFILEKNLSDEGYFISLEENNWKGYNWQVLEEKTNIEGIVDRVFFRKISANFMNEILMFPLQIRVV